jgi:response regulator RpfG family c-di-GMP phosphodiesterase
MTLSDALDEINRETPGLIILDIHLPDGNGLDFLRELRKTSNIPVIALTADAIEGSEQKFLSSGFQAFLTKPINISNLDTAIRKWIMKDVPHTTVDAASHAGDNSKIEIKGINVKLALSIYDGDTELFLDILRSFAEDVPEELEKLRDVTEENLHMYAINVHTIKGAAAGVGARELSTRAAHLEQAAKEKKFSVVQEANEEFLKGAYELIQRISDYFN